MKAAKIKITKHWRVPPKKGYSVGDEYEATLHPCTDHSGKFYAILESGDIIPDGHFSTPEPKDTRVSYNLPGGGHATFDSEPTQETWDALLEMVKLAKKNVKKPRKNEAQV